MDFKWRLSRPGIELEFETGSIGEAIGLLEQEGTQISEVFGFTMGGTKDAQDSTALSTGTVQADTGAQDSGGKPGRKPRTPKVDAVAPPPMPVPGAAPPDMTPGPNGIPAALDRTREVAAPPPPILPSAPSIAPPPPPPAPPVAGVLGAKVVAALEARKPFPDEGKALVAWLAAYQLVVPGCTYDEACEVVLHLSDDKLAAAAGPNGLNVAA